MLPEIFISGIVTLFLVIDPIGNAVWYAGASRNFSRAQKVRQAIQATLIAACLIPLFIFFGLEILGVLHVHLPAFQIAGGLFLLLIGLKMVLEDPGEEKIEAADKSLAVFPLAIPFIAGPDTLAVAMLLLSSPHHEAAEVGAGTGEALSTFGPHLQLLAAAGVVLLLSLIMLIAAGQLSRLIPPQVLRASNAIIGMLLSAFAIEFILEGWFAAQVVHG